MLRYVSLLALFGAVTTASVALQKPPTVPPTALKLLDAYDNLMNDLKLLDEGVLGVNRIPSDPTELVHTKSSLGRTPTKSVTREAIVTHRQALRSEGLSLVGDGMIAREGKQDFLFWSQPRTIDIAFTGPLSKLAADARETMFDEPKRLVTRAVGDGYATAKPILFRHKRCMECHTDKKVGDVAAIAVVTWKPKN